MPSSTNKCQMAIHFAQLRHLQANHSSDCAKKNCTLASSDVSFVGDLCEFAEKEEMRVVVKILS